MLLIWCVSLALVKIAPGLISKWPKRLDTPPWMAVRTGLMWPKPCGLTPSQVTLSQFLPPLMVARKDKFTIYKFRLNKRPSAINLHTKKAASLNKYDFDISGNELMIIIMKAWRNMERCSSYQWGMMMTFLDS